MMRRALVTAMAVGFLSTIGLVGCGEEAKVTESEKVTSPGGTTTTTVEKKVDSSGSNPPTNTEGETAKPK